MTQTYDTVVIGTGVGGLSAGLSLQRQGHSVLLLEAAKQFGGLMNPFSRKKYHFDVGVHYLGHAGPGEILREGLDFLGLEDVRFREINPQCIDRYLFRDYEARLVKGHDHWGDVLARDFPKEEKNIRRFLRLMKLVDDVVRSSAGKRWLGRAVPHTLDLVRLFKVSFGDLLARYFEDPLLRMAFAGCGGDLGLPPERLSSLMSIMVLNYYLGGAYYPVGGSGALRDAFVGGLEKHGAELQRSQIVERIEKRSDGSFAVGTARGDTFVARSVISNIDAVTTLDMLRGARANRATRRKARKVRPSLSAFCVFLATDIDLTQHGITDANIWHYGHNDIDDVYGEIFQSRLPDPPFFFLSAPTLKDPGSGKTPEGHHTLEVITLATHDPYKPWLDGRSMRRPHDYEEKKRRTTERIIDGVERLIPGLRRRLLHQESATPATVWHYVRGRECGIYGPEHSPDQIAFGRFWPNVGVPGLYLAGAGVFGCGISLCHKSGLLAAEYADKYLRQQRSVRLAISRPAASRAA